MLLNTQMTLLIMYFWNLEIHFPPICSFNSRCRFMSYAAIQYLVNFSQIILRYSWQSWWKNSFLFWVPYWLSSWEDYTHFSLKRETTSNILCDHFEFWIDVICIDIFSASFCWLAKTHHELFNIGVLWYAWFQWGFWVTNNEI